MNLHLQAVNVKSMKSTLPMYDLEALEKMYALEKDRSMERKKAAAGKRDMKRGYR